jgi:phenylacetate-CoA ligase
MTSIVFYDALESREAQTREAALLAALPAQVAHAQAHSAAMRQILQGVDAQAITSREQLAKLPVTRKSELHERQKKLREAAPAGARSANDVFGGFNAALYGAKMPRLFASPGPIYEPDGKAPNYWRSARALYAAGFRAGDLVHNALSYHMTPGAWLMESGAHAIGCTVFPAGVGQTEQQLQALADLQPNAYAGTPSFLKILVDKCAESQQRLPIQKAAVSGEAFPPSLRDWLAERGVAAYQSYATADVGMIAYETSAREGLVIDEDVIVEIVRPGTADPVAPGEVGEVVVTTFNPLYPLIRFGTGDLSAVLTGPCPTGRTNMRIKGWMGRADQTTKIRGMFVHPGQVAEVVKRFPEIAKARLVVSGEMANDQMTLKVEARERSEGLVEKISQAVRDVTKLRSEIELLDVGALPNDGKVIEDARSYA